MPTKKELNNWEKEFDKRFGDNVVWWQECVAEMRIGDPDFKSLKKFIDKELVKIRTKFIKREIQLSRELVNLLKAKDKEFIEILDGLEIKEKLVILGISGNESFDYVEGKTNGLNQAAESLNNKIKQIKKKYE